MIKINYLVVVMFIISTNAVFANEENLSQTYSNCMEKSNGVSVNMLNCDSAETAIQDAKLNKAYKELMKELSPERKKELRSVQRLWIKYIDANCNYYADPDGGSLASVMASQCFMDSTTDRASELEYFLKLFVL